jgi:hypothetical protein
MISNSKKFSRSNFCPLKFNPRFQDLPVANKNMFHEIVYQVPIENGEVKDIIVFYNSVFIKRLRLFFVDLPNKTPDVLFSLNSQTPKNNNLSMSNTGHIGTNSNSPHDNPRHRSGKSKQVNTRYPFALAFYLNFTNRHLFPDDVLQSPLNKLLSSPFMGNMGLTAGHSAVNRDGGSPILSAGLNSRDSGSNNSKNKMISGNMISMAVKNSPTFYGPDINLDNTLTQSGSYQRNGNFAGNYIRGPMHSKKILSFEDMADDETQENNNNVIPTTGAQHAREVVGGLESATSKKQDQQRDIHENSKYFSQDAYKFDGQTKDSIEIKNKKFDGKDGSPDSVERKKKDSIGTKKMNDAKAKKCIF